MSKKIDNLVGRKFGFLTVIKELKIRNNNSVQWECVCDCGQNKIARGHLLVNGTTKSCGCKNGTKFIGEKFNYLTVLEKVKYTKINKTTKWKCLCDCGNITYVQRGSICSGDIISCGCNVKYKEKGDRESIVWNSIYNTHFKKNAKKREIYFILSLEEVKSLCVKPCFYCNEPFSLIRKDYFFEQNKIEIKFNGLDRVSSDMGYTLDNVVPCCTSCNRAKNNMTINEFKSWIIKIYDFYIKPTL